MSTTKKLIGPALVGLLLLVTPAGAMQLEEPTTLRYHLQETLVAAPFRLVIRNYVHTPEACPRLRLVDFDRERSRSVYRCIPREEP